jgi:hypothetical protein
MDNNPKAVNNTHHDKAATTTGMDDDDAEKSCQINVGDDMASANNSTSTESPTLVRVKTWYTESIIPTARNLQEQHRYLP